MSVSSGTLEDFLAAQHCPDNLVQIVFKLSEAAQQIATHIAEIGLTASQMGDITGDVNSDGDQQKQLDVIADELILSALQTSHAVNAYYSEEKEDAIICNADADYAVACDPLDGSSNIENNLTIGTIFSIFEQPKTGFPQGRAQKIAGFFSYGPQTNLVLTCGQGVAAFAPNKDGKWQKLAWDIEIPQASSEFAINASNQRFWPQHITRYIADCLAGTEGVRGRNFNMRWLGSLVGDAFRIFRRGGVFLYPEDARQKYTEGRLRLIYEAFPIAFLVEQAGGKATNGKDAILDIEATELHQRIPLIFGSAEEVDRITTHHSS